jgi:hypothetical protein
MPLLLDTGVLYALADADDAWHLRARRLVGATRDLLMTTASVLPEVTYLLHTHLGPAAERAFVASLVKGEVAVQALTAEDHRRTSTLLETYPQIGFVDASVVAVAERLSLTALATTDRRHFGRVRPRHVAAFELLP